MVGSGLGSNRSSSGVGKSEWGVGTRLSGFEDRNGSDCAFPQGKVRGEGGQGTSVTYLKLEARKTTAPPLQPGDESVLGGIARGATAVSVDRFRPRKVGSSY